MGAYLQLRSTLSTSPLWADLQETLGPITYVDEKSAPVPIEDPEASSFHKRQALTPSDAWYTDESNRGWLAMWTPVAIQPETDTIWFDTVVGQSTQWAELCTMWLVAANEAPPLTICTDSWVV